MIEVRIGRERSFGVIRFAWGHLREYERDRTSTATRAQLVAAGGYWALFGMPPFFRDEYAEADEETPFGVEVLPEEIVAWLDEHAFGWSMIERRHFPRSLGEAVYETVLQFPGQQSADDFRSVWAEYLHSRVVTYLRYELAELREQADVCFDWLKTASRDLRYTRAREYIDTERALRRADGELRRTEHEFRDKQRKSV